MYEKKTRFPHYQKLENMGKNTEMNIQQLKLTFKTIFAYLHLRHVGAF
jgi:hypothetical protein